MTHRVLSKAALLSVVAAMALLLAVSGCVTSVSSPQRGESQTSGTGSEGAFRGRWWSFYERGRALFDAETYPEAAKDFQTALKGRATDQRWARTYGLHFIPEYFPNRELGIALYLQDQLSEALQHLERSYEQCPSARCAYYLGKLRVDMARESGDDLEAPRIEMASPPASRLAVRNCLLQGAVTDDVLVHEVVVKETVVPIAVPGKEVHFQQQVALDLGTNRVETIARDLAGNETRLTIEIEVDVDGPAVSFDAPSAKGMLTGVAVDGSGVAALEVAGVPASLSLPNDGLTRFSLDLAKLSLGTGIQYRCFDTLGNQTVGEVPGLREMTGTRADPWSLSEPSRRAGGAGLTGLLIGSAVAAVDTDSTGPSAAAAGLGFRRLEEGQVFRREDIAVVLDIDAPSAPAKLRLADVPLQFVPNRAFQTVTRRVALAMGPNTIRAQLTCANGEAFEVSVTVYREPSPEDVPENLLSLSIIGEVAQGNPCPVSLPDDYLVDALFRHLTKGKQPRFRMVNRSNLSRALLEQELSEALGSSDKRLVLGRLIAAEMISVATQRYSHTLELTIQVSSAETGALVGSAEVAGRVENLDDYDRLVRDLALQLVQVFPRVEGEITEVRNDHEFRSSLCKSDLVFPSLPLLVMRVTDPAWNERDKIREARITKVKTDCSVAEVVSGGATPDALTAPRKGDIVVTR